MRYPSGLSVSERPRPGGDRDGPVVVLVHGSLDRASSFARVVRRLPGVHTVVYDRRGYQGSRPASQSKPGPTLDSHIDDLLEVVDGRAAVLVGHSYGGLIALGGALREAPQSSIISVAAYEPPLPWLPLWSNRGSSAPAPTLVGDPGLVAEQFFCRMVGSDAWARLSEPAREERRADGPALVAELSAIRLPEPPFDVAALSLPALFGRGERSLPHQRAGVEWLTNQTPDSELVDLPGASHGAHLSHPDRFADFVRRALERAFERSSGWVGERA